MTARLLQSLPDAGAPAQLFILLHGVGASADDLVPLAKVLRQSFPQAALLLPDGFEPFDAAPTAAGRQWFSIAGVTEENRAARVQAVVPGLIDWVRGHQARLGVGAAATALVGFSQGSIVSLEAATAAPDLVGRVLAFSGRFAQLPASAPERTTFHFFHGGQDPVIPAQLSTAAFEHVAGLDGGDATLDIADEVGHELHPALLERAIFRLTHHVPPRLWREALSQAGAPTGSA
ncbi:esterase [Sphaerotilus sp.]|uniref:esterase n=1 Tax=Sphaerotilus sp. TaxID=2093942 RepID=UPI002ACDC930|nr:esterase [Sphaerotilus sp.]MDZ7858297.1 esterase [Sphaerotilus sp.]